jgi:uncharacterized protein YdeI (YjbR/CyaY-like superfamily)
MSRCAFNHRSELSVLRSSRPSALYSHAAKKDPRIDAYIAEAAPFAQPILKHLRKLVHQGCPDVEEAIKWSMPAFLHQGKILCHLAAFKAHAAFGFWHQGMEKILAADGFKSGEAMGLLGKLKSRDDLPPDKKLVGYIQAAVKLQASDAPSRAPKHLRPALSEPPDLADGLKRSKKASGVWATFSPSARREYIEWITEAKRPETREQRLLTTLEWVAEGKPRHWKYKNC